jgi:hypothetical protein
MLDNDHHKKVKTNSVCDDGNFWGDEESDDDSTGVFQEQKTTKEQAGILSYKPKMGETVAVNAYAGCGKTTTYVLLLCNISLLPQPFAELPIFHFSTLGLLFCATKLKRIIQNAKSCIWSTIVRWKKRQVSRTSSRKTWKFELRMLMY